jgi:hypothetical protein
MRQHVSFSSIDIISSIITFLQLGLPYLGLGERGWLVGAQHVELLSHQCTYGRNSAAPWMSSQ